MKIVENNILLTELLEMARNRFGDLVKAVVDIEKEIMAVDSELHADEEALLLEKGSKQENLWGINIYPELTGAERIEFDSMINLKPDLGNRTRGIDQQGIKDKIIKIVNKLLK
jgi:hypothetical protein